MTILGIDPGTATTGYGVLRQVEGPRRAVLVECGVIRTLPARYPRREVAGDL